jgi:hypothetical protein
MAAAMTPHWCADFCSGHPAFATLADAAAHLLGPHWPTLSALDACLSAGEVCNAHGLPLRVVDQDISGSLAGAGYERLILERGLLSVRPGNWHDLFNVLIWRSFPLAKAALNRRHCEEIQEHPGPTWGRGPVRDALTLLDESGVVIAASQASLLDGIRAFRWKEVFWTRRIELRAHLRMHVLGHALYEKLRRPYIGLTGHGILLEVKQTVIDAPAPIRQHMLDAMLASIVGGHSSLRSPRDLQPVPLLGMPGWGGETQCETFYDNVGYFRPGRVKPGPPAVFRAECA